MGDDVRLIVYYARMNRTGVTKHLSSPAYNSSFKCESTKTLSSKHDANASNAFNIPFTSCQAERQHAHSEFRKKTLESFASTKETKQTISRPLSGLTILVFLSS